MLKKIIKYFLISCTIYLTLVVLEYARIAFVNDYSLQPIQQKMRTLPPEGETNFPATGVYLISYADGHDYYVQNQNAMTASAMNKGIDFIFNFRKGHLPKSYVQQHPHFKQKTGGGLWLWKPYIISETLSNMPEGAILIYMDANFIFRQPLQPLLKRLTPKKDMLFFTAFGAPQQIQTYTKGNVLQHLECIDQKCLTSPMLASGVMILRNTKKTHAFIQKWRSLCENIKLMDNHITENVPHKKGFKWSFFEGSLLSILAHQQPEHLKILPPKTLFDIAFWAHRKPARASKNKRWYTLYGVKEMPNRITGKALSSVSLLNFPPLVLLRKYIYESIM